MDAFHLKSICNISIVLQVFTAKDCRCAILERSVSTWRAAHIGKIGVANHLIFILWWCVLAASCQSAQIRLSLCLLGTFFHHVWIVFSSLIRASLISYSQCTTKWWVVLWLCLKGRGANINVTFSCFFSIVAFLESCKCLHDLRIWLDSVCLKQNGWASLFRNLCTRWVNWWMLRLQGWLVLEEWGFDSGCVCYDANLPALDLRAGWQLGYDLIC